MAKRNEIRLDISKDAFLDCYLPHLYEYDKRVNCYYGGAGSGKSRFVVQKMILKALKYPNRKILVVRKVTASIRDSIFAEFKTVLSDWKLYDMCKINSTLLYIELPNGSQFVFKGIDDPEKIKSISGIDDIVIEECTELTLDDYSQLSLRLRSKAPHNQIHFMFNPVSKANWVYQYFFANGCPDNTVIVHTNYKHNKFLPQSYIDDLLQMERTNPTYYKIYALGEFATLDKLVYNNWKVEDFNYRDIVRDTSRDVSCYLGLDFGYVNDTNALVCVLIDNKNKDIFIFDEWGEKGLTNDEIYQNIERLGYAKEIIVADSAEQKSIEELKRHGLRKIVPCKKGKDSIMYGIQLIQQFDVYVHPKCEQIIEEFKNYSWQKDKKTNEYINKPIDHFNHYLDALRYAVSYGKKNKIKTLDRIDLGI